MKLIVALTGASGIEYGIDLLKALKKNKIEIHLILSKWAKKVIQIETNYSIEEVQKLGDFVYDYDDMTAAISSSSFLVDGMIVIPASIKTVSQIANAELGNLISRTADNMLKNKRKLIVCVRETPLSPAALEQMQKLALYGAIVMPLSPGFYHKPKDLKELISFITGKVLDSLDIKNNEFKRWG